MKHIFDIYNECDCATPANTMGMGNPMLPTTEEPGTEPLTTKTKREKKRKVVKEGILADVETNMRKGDDLTKTLLPFIEWYVDGQVREYKKFNKETLMNLYMESMSLEDKNTIIIDLSKDGSSFADIMVVKDAIPGNIKTIKVYNCKYEFRIQSYIGDLSNIDIEVYRDNGKSYSNIQAAFKSKVGNDIRFGNVVCSCFTLLCTSENLTIGNDSIILELDTSASSALTNIYGKLSHVDSAKLNKKLVRTQLCQSGFLPWGCELNIR